MKLKKTKIVCTIGPSSFDPAILRNMVKSGMNIVRLNFSHGTHEEKKEQVENIRKIAQELSLPLAVVADLQGPKLRLGSFEGIKTINKGEIVNLSVDPSGDEISLQFDLAPYIKKEQRVYLNDGLVELKVAKVKGKSIQTEALNDGWISSHKGVNIPDTNLGRAAFTDKDRKDAEFAIKIGVDFIALSFVQTVEDILNVRDLIQKQNSPVKIIAKIEKKEAILNLESIIKAADAVMVARGDLAIETSAAEVPIIQQKIINFARQYQKPVIVATHMLESMIENPRPTRAEASDVANAVFTQVDAVMLSAETANGKYPVQAVSTMNNIIRSVEENPDFIRYIKINWANISQEELTTNAIVASASSIAYRINAPVIAVATSTGRTVRMISSFRPNSNIIATTEDENVHNQLILTWGVYPVLVEPVEDSDLFWDIFVKTIKDHEFASTDERIVLVGGSKIGVSGATDTIKVTTL